MLHDDVTIGSATGYSNKRRRGGTRRGELAGPSAMARRHSAQEDLAYGVQHELAHDLNHEAQHPPSMARGGTGAR